MYDTFFKRWMLNTTIVELVLMLIYIAVGLTTWWIAGLFALGFFSAWAIAVVADKVINRDV